jgi:hypothetical protein
MSNDEIIKELETLSFTAALNVRYRQEKASRYLIIDKTIRITIGFLSIISLIVALKTDSKSNKWLFDSSIILSIISLFVSYVLNIIPFSDSALFHKDILRRWGEFREEVEIVLFESKKLSTNKTNSFVEKRFNELNAKKNRLNALDEKPDSKLLEKCQRAENKTRTGYETQKQYDSMQK